MPWKVLGQKWHVSRRGFPLGKKVKWETEVLEDLCELLHEMAPDAQFLWNSQQVVPLMVKEQRAAWATLHTKRPDGLDLVLVSADFDDQVGAAHAFLADQVVDFPTWLKTGKDMEFIDHLNPDWGGALPATFVYDANGELRAFWEGKASDVQREQRVLPILEEADN